jgi:hypothetical protein
VVKNGSKILRIVSGSIPDRVRDLEGDVAPGVGVHARHDLGVIGRQIHQAGLEGDRAHLPVEGVGGVHDQVRATWRSWWRRP